MKRHNNVIICVLLIMIMLVSLLFPAYAVGVSGSVDGKETICQEKDAHSSNENILAGYDDSLVSARNFHSIIGANPYDETEVIEKGIDIIRYIGDAHTESGGKCAYFKDAEIVDFTFLHSFDTGEIRYVSLDFRAIDGSAAGFLILDCTDDSVPIWGTGESGVMSSYHTMKMELAKNDRQIFTNMQATDDEIYFFYYGMNFGCGIVKDNRMYIYEINDLLHPEDNAMPKAYISDFSSPRGEERPPRSDYESACFPVDADKARKIEERYGVLENNLLENEERAITYPSEAIINGVPDYMSNTTYSCIPTSMANIIAYWDMNGFPDLVPTSSHYNREIYIKSAITSYMQECTGGTTSNSSIDPAFDNYISDHGSYRYSGIDETDPLFSYLQAEIYSYESPCLIGIPNYYASPHCTTGVGYDTTIRQRVIVHDNHSDTVEDFMIYWSEVDFMFSCSIRNAW